MNRPPQNVIDALDQIALARAFVELVSMASASILLTNYDHGNAIDAACLIITGRLDEAQSLLQSNEEVEEGQLDPAGNDEPGEGA